MENKTCKEMFEADNQIIGLHVCDEDVENLDEKGNLILRKDAFDTETVEKIEVGQYLRIAFIDSNNPLEPFNIYKVKDKENGIKLEYIS